MPAIWMLTAALGIACSAAAGQAVSFVGEVSPDNAEGHLTLRWEGESPWPAYQVEHATDSDFGSAELWYEGPATQTFISGLEEGEHHYRVRAREDASGDWGAWSEPVGLTVKHQPMGLAWSLFFVGLVLFGSIVGFVLWQVLGGRLSEEAADE